MDGAEKLKREENIFTTIAPCSASDDTGNWQGEGPVPVRSGESTYGDISA